MNAAPQQAECIDTYCIAGSDVCLIRSGRGAYFGLPASLFTISCFIFLLSGLTYLVTHLLFIRASNIGIVAKIYKYDIPRVLKKVVATSLVK